MANEADDGHGLQLENVRLKFSSIVCIPRLKFKMA